MNAKRALKRIGLVLGLVLGLLLLVGAGLALKVTFRPPLVAIPSTTHGTIERQGCIQCHAPIAAEWRQSYHYRSLTGSYWVEARQLGYLRFFEKVRKPCVNCHAPANVLDLAVPAGSQAAELGVECTPNVFRDPPGMIPAARSDDVELGVDCTACHVSGHGILGTGRRPTAAHETLADRRFQNSVLTSGALCRTCHRSTVEAWERTSLAAQGVTCLDCHMPQVRAASVAGGPARLRRSHRFPADKNESMLTQAVNASLELVEGRVARLRITNDRVGHHLPTGGNWLSVRLMAYDSSGRMLKEQMEAFGRNETLLLDFWPFNTDSRIPFGEQREIRFSLPQGHGTVEAVIRYHDWMHTRRVVRTLRRDY
jgi:nitrate/TMAO reductase-like tetraheme cytochrome c subunit